MQPTPDLSQDSSTYNRTKVWRVLTWSFVVLWMACIYYWSSQSTLPGFDRSIWDLLFKKGCHIAVFGALALLSYRAIRHDMRHVEAIIGAAVLAIGWGILDEIHQGFVPGRTAAILDVFIDSVGVIAVLTIVQLRRSKLVLPNATRGKPDAANIKGK